MRAILCLGLALVAVGCISKGTTGEERGAAGTQRGANSGKQKHDPCSLITKEEMSAATGEQFLEAKADGSECTYLTADASVASASVQSTWDGPEARVMVGAMNAGAEVAKVTPTDGSQMVPGVGDEASFAMYALTVRKGDAAFSIRLNMPGRLYEGMQKAGGGGPQKYATDILAMDKVLADKALTRL